MMKVYIWHLMIEWYYDIVTVRISIGLLPELVFNWDYYKPGVECRDLMIVVGGVGGERVLYKYYVRQIARY